MNNNLDETRITPSVATDVIADSHAYSDAAAWHDDRPRPHSWKIPAIAATAAAIVIGGVVVGFAMHGSKSDANTAAGGAMGAPDGYYNIVYDANPELSNGAQHVWNKRMTEKPSHFESVCNATECQMTVSNASTEASDAADEGQQNPPDRFTLTRNSDGTLESNDYEMPVNDPESTASNHWSLKRQGDGIYTGTLTQKLLKGEGWDGNGPNPQVVHKIQLRPGQQYEPLPMPVSQIFEGRFAAVRDAAFPAHSHTGDAAWTGDDASTFDMQVSLVRCNPAEDCVAEIQDKGQFTWIADAGQWQGSFVDKSGSYCPGNMTYTLTPVSGKYKEFKLEKRQELMDCGENTGSTDTTHFVLTFTPAPFSS